MPLCFLFFDWFSEFFNRNNPDEQPSDEEIDKDAKELDEFTQMDDFDEWDELGQIPKTPPGADDEPRTDPELPAQPWWKFW